MTDPLAGFSEEDLQLARKALVSQGIKEVTLDIVALITVVKSYKLFTDEGADRFDRAADTFFREVALILRTEAEIARLRQSD